jgi:hypothetical protein
MSRLDNDSHGGIGCCGKSASARTPLVGKQTCGSAFRWHDRPALRVYRRTGHGAIPKRHRRAGDRRSRRRQQRPFALGIFCNRTALNARWHWQNLQSVRCSAPRLRRCLADLISRSDIVADLCVAVELCHDVMRDRCNNSPHVARVVPVQKCEPSLSENSALIVR